MVLPCSLISFRLTTGHMLKLRGLSLNRHELYYLLFRLLCELCSCHQLKHNKGSCRCKHCVNFASFELFLKRNSGLYIIRFTTLEVQNVNKAFVYISDFTTSLNCNHVVYLLTPLRRRWTLKKD